MPSPMLQTADFWLYLHIPRRGSKFSGDCYKGTNPINEGSTLMTSIHPQNSLPQLTLSYFPKVSPPNTIPWEGKHDFNL